MILDEKETEAARARHAEGVGRLNGIFVWNSKDAARLRQAKRDHPAGPRRKLRKRGKAQRLARAKNR